MIGNKKIYILVICFFLSVSVFSGCASMGEDTQKGALGGALIGSIAGGVIGHQGGHGIGGAAIGAGVGALAGGLIGHNIDAKKSKEEVMASAEKLGISDVIVLAQSGVSDDVIVDKISKTRSVFDLSVEEIEALRKQGVSPRVINFMLDTSK